MHVQIFQPGDGHLVFSREATSFRAADASIIIWTVDDGDNTPALYDDTLMTRTRSSVASRGHIAPGSLSSLDGSACVVFPLMGQADVCDVSWESQDGDCAAVR